MHTRNRKSRSSIRHSIILFVFEQKKEALKMKPKIPSRVSPLRISETEDDSHLFLSLSSHLMFYHLQILPENPSFSSIGFKKTRKLLFPNPMRGKSATFTGLQVISWGKFFLHFEKNKNNHSHKLGATFRSGLNNHESKYHPFLKLSKSVKVLRLGFKLRFARQPAKISTRPINPSS
jgi:hypothetical protein